MQITDIYPNLKEDHIIKVNSVIDDLDDSELIQGMINDIVESLSRVIMGESAIIMGYNNIDLSPPTMNYNIFISLFEGLLRLSTEDNIITLSVLALQGNKCYDLLNLNSSKQTVDIFKNADTVDYRNNMSVKLNTINDFEQVNHIITNNINIVEMGNTKQKISTVYYILSSYNQNSKVVGRIGFVLLNSKEVTPVGSSYFVSLYHVLHSVLRKSSFIPYRDSKFTYFLQPLLNNCSVLNFIINFPSVDKIAKIGGIIGLVNDLKRCLKMPMKKN